VVNAPLLTIVSQIDGRIHQGAAVKAKRSTPGKPWPWWSTTASTTARSSISADRSMLLGEATALRGASTISPALGGAARRGREYQTALVDRLEHEVKRTRLRLHRRGSPKAKRTMR